MRRGGTTSENPLRSPLAFARNNDLSYDNDSSPSPVLRSTLSYFPFSVSPSPPHFFIPRRSSLPLLNFNQTWPNFRTSATSGDTTRRLGRSFSPSPAISRPPSNDLSPLGAHLVAIYKRSLSLSLAWCCRESFVSLKYLLFPVTSRLVKNGLFLFTISISHAITNDVNVS